VNSLAYPVAALAGMALYVGLYQLAVFVRRPERLPRDAYFAMSALSLFAYDVFSVGLYQSHDLAEGSWYQRYQLAAIGIGTLPFVRFLEAYAGRRLPGPIRMLGWVFPIVGVIIAFERSDLCLAPEVAVKHVVLPFLGEIVYYERAFGPLATWVGFGVPYVTGVAAWAAWVLARSNPTRARLFSAGATVFAVGLVNDTLIAREAYKSLYFLEYAWSGILVVMGAALSQEIADAATARQELVESRIRLTHTERLESLGRLAGGVAHDLNNMLTPALNYAELTRRRMPVGTREHEHLGHVIAATERAATLTKQLLAFGRKQVLETTVIDFGATLRELSPLLVRLVPESVALRTTIDDGLPCVLADRAALEQVLMNLVANARDSIRGNGEVAIAVESVARAGDELQLRVRVSDTGVGMNEETRRRIFEPFFTTKPRGKGTGLGLSIVQGIVLQHGGTIAVESTVGAGSTFTLTFPSAAPGTALEVRRRSDPPRSFAGLVGARVLVVDDDPVVRHLIEELLVDGGYRVRTAGSAEELRALLATSPKRFDLLISDVVLEDASGVDIRELVSEAQPGVPCLFVSGHAEETLAPRGMLEPGVELIRKPFHVDELLAVVSRSLQSRRPR